MPRADWFDHTVVLPIELPVLEITFNINLNIHENIKVEPQTDSHRSGISNREWDIERVVAIKVDKEECDRWDSHMEQQKPFIRIAKVYAEHVEEELLKGVHYG